MDAAVFLDRVVAPGNYLAVCHRAERPKQIPGEPPPKLPPMLTRMFPRGDTPAVARHIFGLAKYRHDVWFTPASFRLATPSGRVDSHNRQVLGAKGDRTAQNAMNMRSFFVDLDVKEKGYKTRSDAASALRSFLAASQLPWPNLSVCSGYGLHLYWTLEDAMSVGEWLPYAEALKAVLTKHQVIFDSVVPADAARLLRPPETVNFKDPANPVPVKVIGCLAHYPNATMLQALQPYVSATTIKATGTGPTVGVISGTVSSIAAGRQSKLNAAAQSGVVHSRPPASGTDIARKCLQVKQSMAVGGKDDEYPLWYLGFMSLAHFLEDGHQFAHDISKGDAKYNPANVDKHLDQVAKEKGTSHGAPTCAFFNAVRSGVCGNCPHNGKINSPISLGSPDGDLPDGWRRQNNKMQHLVEKDEDGRWADVLHGDVYSPTIDDTGYGYVISFTYEFQGRTRRQIIPHVDMARAPSLSAYFGAMNMQMKPPEAKQFEGFIVDWITKLRRECAERDLVLPPFGWAKPDGFAVAGALYRADGTEEPAPGANQILVQKYTPAGTLDVWKDVCAFVTKGRPDLQTIVAVAFGSPLMGFTGLHGLCINVWSRDSAVGKTSAFTVSQAVWAHPTTTMCALTDTINQVREKVAGAKVMPSLWDEMRPRKGTDDAMVNFFFDIAQGKDKGRLNSDASLKEIRDWTVLALSSSNAPLMDKVRAQSANTDAGEVRLLEIELTHPKMSLDPRAAARIARAEKNYGHAGREYAKYLAAHEADIEKHVLATSERFTKEVGGAFNEERFFVAGIAAIIVGATIANTLDLTKFDVKGMWDFLRGAFMALRKDRDDNSVVHNGQVDLEELFGRFVDAHAPQWLVTSAFKKPGRYSVAPKLVKEPTRAGIPLVLHTGQADIALRFNKQAFDKWATEVGMSGSVLRKQIAQRWGLRFPRTSLGEGTPWEGGRVTLLELPLRAPELQQYLCLDGAPQPSGQAKPATAPALAGPPTTTETMLEGLL